MSRYFDPVATGHAIKRLRQEHHYTVEQLAEKLNITPQAIYKWQNGEATPSTPILVELLDVFNLPNLDCIIIYRVVDDRRESSLDCDSLVCA